jgi:hypothetical protein
MFIDRVLLDAKLYLKILIRQMEIKLVKKLKMELLKNLKKHNRIILN